MNSSPESFTAALARELRIALMDAGMNRTELVVASGIPYRTLKRYLDGEREISVCTLRTICEALSVPMVTVVGRAEAAVADDDG